MRLVLALVVLMATFKIPLAQELQLSELLPKDDGTFTGRIIQGLIILTVLSIAPGLLITTTCFTRFIIAFSFLRSGMGLQSTPSNLIVISLAMFMTYFVMAPVFEKSWNDGVQPMLENKISREDAFNKITVPMKEFMLQHVRPKDIQLFEEFQNAQDITTDNLQVSPALKIVIPAFMLSELRKGFEIGFLILLPFLIIDLVVATVTMSMGMMMLPPTVVSLPFKILFFVLVDGWNMIVGELLTSVL